MAVNETAGMWVKTDNGTNNAEVIGLTAGNFSHIYNGDTLVGFEGCFAVEGTQSGSFMLDAHMEVTVATDPAKGPTTSRVRCAPTLFSLACCLYCLGACGASCCKRLPLCLPHSASLGSLS